MQLPPRTPTRRRVLQLVASAGGAALAGGLGVGRVAAEARRMHQWRGRALGADASIALDHPAPDAAADLIKGCVAEIEHLEGLFSLYDGASAICRLNAAGMLDAPPADFRDLAIRAREIWDASEHAFDPTVQPLWELYADHFSQSDADPVGPPADILNVAHQRVDMDGLSVDADRIAFNRPGMAVTFNGIAQGYITDRITRFLKAAGMTSVLINLGEYRAIGHHPSGRPWHIGIADPRAPWRAVEAVSVSDGAVATSSGLGTVFDETGRFHHLFDPRTGKSASHYECVTVTAPDATTADALSTALAVTAPERAETVLSRFPKAGAILRLADARTLRLGAG